MSTSSSTRRCIQFSLEDIKAATNEFDSSNFLGKGGEAMVYFAEIYIGSKKTPVAVKHLNAPKTKKDNTKEFESEIQTLAKIQHPNIISLIGYCNESGQKILVYEYMENGCLSDYLKKKKDKPLSWLQRLNICLDVARGLQHLHSEIDEFGKGIIHRDVKPGNILVGENWVGKLSDFGMLKLSNSGQLKSSMVTDHKGTAGYYAPEYLHFGRVTRKIDVYAFGVVLFQVLCEKSPWDREDESYYFNENEDLGIWAQKNFDAQIRREMSGDSFTLFTDIIGRSLQGNPGKRPTMEKVVLDLENVLLECQESENQPKQLDDTEETYLQPSPSKQPTIDDVVLNLRRCCQFSIREIEAGTNKFDSRKIIGKGSESTVYFAGIYIGSNITPVAVKHLKENSKEFEREIYTLSKIHHPNLVSLIGYCDESGHKILLYEYMAKGCLSYYLKKKSSVSLSWLQRLNICLGVARGLQHLHTGTDEFPKGIIHRDVKPGNILVGENWVGKLSDFGMFKLSNAGQSGYYAPEYIKYGRITRKIDVYAFGVVLFEVLCRKMPWDREDESYYAKEDEDLGFWAQQDLGFWAQQNVDALIQGEITGDSLAVFTDIIRRSLQENPGRRPTMDDVVLDLQKALECQESVYLAKQLEGSPRGFEGITSKVYTLEEVSRHNKIDDFWRIISGKVYDLTPFMDDHPGGDEVLLSSKKDATQEFEDVGHSDSARDMMGEYYLGYAIVNTGGFEGITYKVYTFEGSTKSSSNPIKEEVKGSGQDDKPTCQICKRRNHEAIDCSYRFDRSYQS